MKTKTPFPSTSLEINAPRIIAVSVLAALLLFALTGCTSKPRATNEKVNPAGVYALVSVDGNQVPCTLKHEGVAMLVKSGSFTINSDGTCRSFSTFSVPPHPDVNRDVKATYTQSGSELTMKWQGAGVTKGQLNGSTFTMNNEGMVFSYRK